MRRPLVRESPLANSVTSWPSLTSSSVKYATTRSVPPYSCGGTLSVNGATCAILMTAESLICNRCARLRARMTRVTPPSCESQRCVARTSYVQQLRHAAAATRDRRTMLRLVFLGGGAALVAAALVRFLRARRASSKDIDVGAVSDAWLAERRGMKGDS